MEIMNKKLQSDLDDMRAQFRALQDQLKAIGSAASSAAPSQVVPAVSGSSSAAPLLGATALRKEPKKDDVLQTAPSSFAELMKWVSRAGHQIRFYKSDETCAASWFSYIGPDVQPVLRAQSTGTAKDLFDVLLRMSASSDLGTTIMEQRRNVEAGESLPAFMARMKVYLDFAESIRATVPIPAPKWAAMLRADAVTTDKIIGHNVVDFDALYAIVLQGQLVARLTQDGGIKAPVAVTDNAETAAVNKRREEHSKQQGRDRRCPNCDRTGHVASQCRACYACGGDGHIAARCPTRGNQGRPLRGNSVQGRGMHGGRNNGQQRSYGRRNWAGAVDEEEETDEGRAKSNEAAGSKYQLRDLLVRCAATGAPMSAYLRVAGSRVKVTVDSGSGVPAAPAEGRQHCPRVRRRLASEGSGCSDAAS